MAVRPWRIFVSFFKNFLSSLKNVVKRNQITFINSSVTVILITVVIVVLLNRATALQRETAEESVRNLAGQISYEIQGFYFSYMDIARTVVMIMEGYQIIEPEQRRNYINDTMMSVFAPNLSLINIFSLWKPDALDGMDALNVNTRFGDETGQFISGFSRERGWEERTFPEYKYLLVSDNDDLGLGNGTFFEPVNPRVYDWDDWRVNIFVPIQNQGRAVGLLGLTVSLNRLQYLAGAVRPYRTGRTMVITNSGTIIAHNDYQLRGYGFYNPDEREPLLAGGIQSDVYYTLIRSISTQQPETVNTSDAMIVMFPLSMGGVMYSGFQVTGASRWAVVTVVPLTTVLAPINTLLRFSIVFVIGAAIVMAFVVIATSRSLTQRARVLQRDLEHASAMQDNLKFGLFLMDQNYKIQSAYSKALERIFSVSNLGNRNFIDLISKSLKPNEMETFKDYLDMVFKQAFDEEMLADLNPISEFNYVSPETGEIKVLRSSFSMAEGQRFLMGTMEDITAEIELQKRLMEAANIREKEMQSIFQVIQLNPRVLKDFIDDAEYEFNMINKMLKDKKKVNREIMVEIFQHIHAIKSNALILNLESFADKLHTLESSIRNIQEKHENDVPFDDLLHIVLELNEVMKEKDELEAAISKIDNFRKMSGEEELQERYVLIETLQRVCQKTQKELNKKVRLEIEGIDQSALDFGPRRVIKEVLTQLVRNAVYHGIETPEERDSKGKDPEGEIRLSIKHRNDQIEIKFADNGTGIDFGRIREKAKAKNLIINPAYANNMNYLLKTLFSPGFSTIEEADFHAGRGIGLSLVKDRIKELGGNINVSTSKGKGTVFTIKIPIELPERGLANAS